MFYNWLLKLHNRNEPSEEPIILPQSEMLPMDLGKYCHSCYFWVLPLLQSGPVKRWFSSSESLIQAFCSYVWLMKHSHFRNNNCKGFGGNSYWALAFAIWESDRDRCRVSQPAISAVCTNRLYHRWPRKIQHKT